MHIKQTAYICQGKKSVVVVSSIFIFSGFWLFKQLDPRNNLSKVYDFYCLLAQNTNVQPKLRIQKPHAKMVTVL